jgi:hypothetical protein
MVQFSWCVGVGSTIDFVWLLEEEKTTLTIEKSPMGKKKSGKGEAPTKAVKIDRALAAKAQMIATDRGMPLADYISETLRGAVEKDWAKMVRRVGGEGGQD